VQERGVGALGLTHQAEIDLFAAHRLERACGHRPPDSAVGTGQADGPRAGGADRGDERRVVSAGQDADHRVERRRVRDAQAVDEARRLTARAKLGIDRAATAVHDGQRSVGGEAHDGRRRALHRGRVFEQFPPELQDSDHEIPEIAFPGSFQLSAVVSSKPNTTLKF
jgi:hypothetical protein